MLVVNLGKAGATSHARTNAMTAPVRVEYDCPAYHDGTVRVDYVGEPRRCVVVGEARDRSMLTGRGR